MSDLRQHRLIFRRFTKFIYVKYTIYTNNLDMAAARIFDLLSEAYFLGGFLIVIQCFIVEK